MYRFREIRTTLELRLAARLETILSLRTRRRIYAWCENGLRRLRRLRLLLSAERGFNQAVRLVGGKEYFRGIIHAEGRKIHEIEMLVGQ